MTARNTNISLQEIAAARGGYCIATYTNMRARVEWQCAHGHKWTASVNNVYYNNSWCPHCKIGLGESICKLYFETIFNEPFIKTRPDWLKNDKGNKLELDGYCEKLGIAFEYNGEQHYSDNNPWKKDLLVRQSWDAMKLSLCKENQIKLIVIPQLFSRLKIADFKMFLKQELEYLGITIPDNYDSLVFNLSKINEPNSFIEYKSIALNKGGKCLSSEYVNCRSKLQWECSEGHMWWAVPYTIKNGSWCPYCAGVASLTLDQVKGLIREKNGICLSNSYESQKDKILIHCNVCENEWLATVDKIKQGRWCPKCANKRKGRKKNG